MRRAVLIAPVMLLAGCALWGGQRHFAAAGETAVDALDCARDEAREIGYVVTSLPRADPYAAEFRAERFLSPDANAERGSLGVITAEAVTGSDGRPRLRVVGERFEQRPRAEVAAGPRSPGTPARGPLGGLSGIFPSGREGDGQWEHKRVSPGEVAWDASRVRQACAAPKP